MRGKVKRSATTKIDPDVVAVANEHFFYLADAHSEMTIVLGDARISLERELARDGSQGFDVLVVDAFSGGGIPTHLLTREAFDLYWGHLREGGVIVVNSSNVFMELGGIVRRQAEALGAQAVLVQHERNFRPGETRNKWVLVTKNATFLRAIARHVDSWPEGAFEELALDRRLLESPRSDLDGLIGSVPAGNARRKFLSCPVSMSLVWTKLENPARGRQLGTRRDVSVIHRTRRRCNTRRRPRYREASGQSLRSAAVGGRPAARRAGR